MFNSVLEPLLWIQGGESKELITNSRLITKEQKPPSIREKATSLKIKELNSFSQSHSKTLFVSFANSADRGNYFITSDFTPLYWKRKLLQLISLGLSLRMKTIRLTFLKKQRGESVRSKKHGKHAEGEESHLITFIDWVHFIAVARVLCRHNINK